MVNSIPFKNVDEAKENAQLLRRTLVIYEVKWSDGTAIGLQQIQNLVAKVLGCLEWKDLVQRLSLGRQLIYLDRLEDPDSVHWILAERFGMLIGDTIQPIYIYAAFHAAAFGFTPPARNEKKKIMSSNPCITGVPFEEIQRIETCYQRHGRYIWGKSRYEAEMLIYLCDASIANLLGIPAPPKPKK